MLVALVLAAIAYLTVPMEAPELHGPLQLVSWSLNSGGAASGHYRVTCTVENVGRTDLHLKSINVLPDLRQSLPAVSAYIELEGRRRVVSVPEDGAFDPNGLSLRSGQRLTLGLELQGVDAAPLTVWLEADPSPPHSSLRVSYRRYA
ncbi:MAG: hypothetical protein ACM3ZA_00645 [Bacillota bacterium]